MGWAAAYLAFLAILFAVSYPVMIGSVIALALAVAFGSRVMRRRREHSTQRVCIPATDVCVEM